MRFAYHPRLSEDLCRVLSVIYRLYFCCWPPVEQREKRIPKFMFVTPVERDPYMEVGRLNSRNVYHSSILGPEDEEYTRPRWRTVEFFHVYLLRGKNVERSGIRRHCFYFLLVLYNDNASFGLRSCKITASNLERHRQLVH